MKKASMTSMILMLSLLTTAMFASVAKGPELVFEMGPLIEGSSNEGAPYILQDSNGKIWVFFISEEIDMGYRHVFYTTSMDKGITWAEPSVFLPAYVPGTHSLCVTAFQDSTGKFWVAWQKYWGVADEDEIWFTTSTDGGNWADAEPLCMHGNKLGSFIEAEGKIWFFFSPFANGFHLSYKTTADGGNSWSDPVEVTASYDAWGHAIVLSNGTIFVVYIHYPNTIGYCSSSDGGLTWNNALFDNPEPDGVPKAVEYQGKIYVFFPRFYTLSPTFTSDIWFKVYDNTGWGPAQQMTQDPQNFENWPTPARVDNQIWIVWDRAIDSNAEEDIWLSKAVSPISWEYVFEDPCRGTVLKISTDDKNFQFIAPETTFPVKHDPNMKVIQYPSFTYMVVSYGDSVIKLTAFALDGTFDSCIAYARNMQTGKTHVLFDKPGIE